MIKITKEQLEDSILKGKSLVSIAKEYSCSRQWLYLLCKKYGFKLKKEKHTQIKRRSYYNLKKKDPLAFAKRSKFQAKRHFAKTLGIEFSLKEEEIIWPETCPVLGVPLVYERGYGVTDYYPSFDRIDPTKGYTKENTIIVSWKANRIKNNATVKELELVYTFYKQFDF